MSVWGNINANGPSEMPRRQGLVEKSPEESFDNVILSHGGMVCRSALTGF